jgi:uncharacterized protein DUF3489
MLVVCPASIRRQWQRRIEAIAACSTNCGPPDITTSMSQSPPLFYPARCLKTLTTAGGSAGPRAGSKQARVIGLLQRPEGATIDEIASPMGLSR